MDVPEYDFEAAPAAKKKNKFKARTIEEDPHQYHAKPRDLSKDALEISNLNVSSSGTYSDENSVFSGSCQDFSKFGLDSKLASHITGTTNDDVAKGMGFKMATKVQSIVMKAMLPSPSNTKKFVRKNVLIKSQTGSGKTMAYLVPIVNDLMLLNPTGQQNRSGGTQALVVAPTRELCAQIADVLHDLTQCCVWIIGGSITGGEKKKSEKARLRKGVNVLVATPGRLLDHLRTTESFKLNNLRWIVLDEADRLLDMGFEQVSYSVYSGV